MPTLVDIEGFEDQVTTSNSTATMNPKLWDTSQATPLSFVTGRDGSGKALRCTQNATNANRLLRNLTTPGTLVVASFYVRLVTTPTGVTARMFHVTCDSVGLIGVNTSGAITAAYSTGTSNSPATGPSLTDNLWHRVDCRFNTSPATHTVEWSVDGATQTNATSGLAAGSNIASWAAGDNLTTTNAVFEIDDIVISVTSGDHPIGDHIVFAVVPNDDNAASVYGTNIMEQGTGTDLSSSNKAYQYLDEWPPTTGTNNADSVTQVGGTSSNFVDVEMGAAPSYASSTLWGVMAIVAHQSDSTLANAATSRIVDSSGTTLTDIYSGDMSETSAHYTRRIISAPGGGWSVSNFNGVRARVGLGTDVSPQPEWLALQLQAATPDQPIATASPAVVAGVGDVPAATASGGSATEKPRRMLLRGTGGPR